MTDNVMIDLGIFDHLWLLSWGGGGNHVIIGKIFVISVETRDDIRHLTVSPFSPQTLPL